MEKRKNVKSRSVKPLIYYSQRFSLCVLDVLRKLQNELQNCDDGISKIEIYKQVANEDFVDGDILTQIDIALAELENTGFVMKYLNGKYRMLGPYAKLCLAKGPKQKRSVWDRIESQIYD